MLVDTKKPYSFREEEPDADKRIGLFINSTEERESEKKKKETKHFANKVDLISRLSDHKVVRVLENRLALLPAHS